MYNVTLSPKVEMPILGLGTWKMLGKECENAARMALAIGYRHFDTAHAYNNHVALGNALHDFPREELFITSKFTPDQLDSETVEETCDRALKELNCHYLDLYLLHYPDRSKPMDQILRAMHQLVQKRKVNAIGVSNCTVGHIRDLLQVKIPFCVNQVEFHPYLYQKELWKFCEENKVQIVSYSPFGKGSLVSDPLCEKIGESYGKTGSQVILKWLIQKKIPTIPKASSRQHLEDNFNVFDFTLSLRDSEILDRMQVQQRFCDPTWFDFNYT